MEERAGMTRREMLRAMGVAAAAPGFVVGCAAPNANVVPPYRGPRLAPVLASRDRVIRTVVGLRPFRPSGFVVRAEKLGPKLLVHNYGHGGGGVTLSWGTSALAVEQAMLSGARSAAVIGCGVIGLSTARLLQRRGFDVTIYARDLPPETTSNIAGAWWNPFDVYDTEAATPEFLAQFQRATRIAYESFQALIGPDYGVRWLPVYALRTGPIAESAMLGTQSPIREFLPGFRDLAPDEKPFPFPVVRTFQAMMIEPPIYLSALMRDVRMAGARIVVREMKSLADLASLPEPVVVNCTGLGARTLVNDPDLIPIKGQLTVLLPQPEIDYVALPPGLYMLPRRDGILLGGTFVRGDYTLEPDRVAEERILASHARTFAEMNKAACSPPGDPRRSL